MSISVVRRVGIIGLGKMGQPMARHLRKAGFEVTAYDVDEHARGQAQRSGITLAASPRAAEERSDFVIVAVGFDQAAATALLAKTARRRTSGMSVGIARRSRARWRGSPHKSCRHRHASTYRSRAASRRQAGQLLHQGGRVIGGSPAASSFTSAIWAPAVGKSEQSDPVVAFGQPRGLSAERLGVETPPRSSSGESLETRPETMPMPWAEKDLRIVQSEADRLRLPVPLCGVVAEVVKSIKIGRGWPTPAQRET